MKTFHMVEEHNNAPDSDIITIRLMLSPGSKNSSSRGTRVEYQGKKMTQSFEDQMLNFMSEKKKNFEFA